MSCPPSPGSLPPIPSSSPWFWWRDLPPETLCGGGETSEPRMSEAVLMPPPLGRRSRCVRVPGEKALPPALCRHVLQAVQPPASCGQTRPEPAPSLWEHRGVPIVPGVEFHKGEHLRSFSHCASHPVGPLGRKLGPRFWEAFWLLPCPFPSL